MGGVVAGFTTIGALIALGFLLAQLGILDETSTSVLARLAFFVASPALLLTVLAGSDVTGVLSANLLATAAGILAAGTLYVVAARLVWRRDLGSTVIGTLCAGYVNAGNLGLPIAAYVLGDASLIAPLLLTQLLVLQPVALTVLDVAAREGPLRWSVVLGRPFRTPLTVASLIGVALALTGTRLPKLVDDPLTLVGGMAVPAMLIGYGVSLRLGPLPGRGEPPYEIGYLVALKLLVQPAVAYAVARFGLGLDGVALLAVTVTSALPTAQNTFVHATRYDRAPILARDAIFVSTLLSVPAIVVIVALLT